MTKLVIVESLKTTTNLVVRLPSYRRASLVDEIIFVSREPIKTTRTSRALLRVVHMIVCVSLI
jgi:hypothetical protein